MNFFEAQDRARRSTRRLVVLYLLATASIIVGVTLIIALALAGFSSSTGGSALLPLIEQQAPLIAGVAIVTTLVIAGATLFKTSMLSAGGGRVARDLGGTLVSTDVQDPLRQRLRNIVEEIAIASGVPVPEIYVLEQENGINAFAAGFAPADAAIAVTRGTLELLDRDELQGVIAHEFSHILNGDMRLNIRLMGVLFGIMVLGLIGRIVLRGGRYSAFATSRRNRGAPAVLIIGLGLTILGAIGVFFARVIKASVSRQREYLADASAVQFTRQTAGLANALKKIGGYDAGSYLQAADPEEVSHMLFGSGSRLSGLFATHPPLTDRIRALDPGFRATDYPVVDLRSTRVARESMQTEHQRPAVTSGIAGATAAPSPEAVVESVGNPDQQQVEFAARLRATIPDVLYDAAHSSELAFLLSVALVMDRSGRVLDRQVSLAHEQLGEQRARLVERYFAELAEIDTMYRLPLLEIAFPALKRRPPPQLGYLIELAGRMIDVDGDIDLYEFCFYRVLVSSLQHVLNPTHRPRRRRAARKPVREAAIELIRIVAHHGHDGDAAGETAFRAGLATFGDWASAAAYETDFDVSAFKLDKQLDMLIALNAEGRQMLIKAVSTTIMFDGTLTTTEAELMRAICASLECPLPPSVISRPNP
ncbi:MAG: M48 family metallopeptidase [Woeseiaceae bacterium]